MITAISAAPDGNNKILIFDNGANPVYITVEEGAEGNIAVAPGKARTTVKSDLIITHNGTGLLTYHNKNWFDDEDAKRFVYKEGPGTLLFGITGWKFGGGLVIRNGRVKTILDSAFGTGTLTMTGGGLSSIGNEQRWFTNSFFFANSLTFCDSTDTGTLVFGPQAVGTLMSNTVMNTQGNGLILQGPIGDNGMNRTLTKIGSGNLALASANSYGGGTILGQGRIRIGNNESFGTGSLTVTNGAISSNSAGDRFLTNNYFFANSITLGHAAEPGALEFSGSGTLTADTTLEIIVDTTLSSAIGQSGGDWSLTKTGPGVLKFTLAQINTFAGGLFVKEGTLAVNNSHDRLGSGAVTLDGGTLRYIGVTANGTIHRDLIIGDNGGTLELNTNERYINWNKTLSGSGTLTKTGIGPLIIDATITHTGAVTVAQGLMQVNQTYPQGGAVTVQSGGAIGGTGIIERDCTIASGGKIDPGAFSIGTLTLDTLSVETNTVYLLEIDGASNDCVAVNENLTLPETFNITVSQSAPAPIRNKVIFTYGGEYNGPQSAIVTADGDVDPDARYEIIHVAQEKQVLFQRAPEGTVILGR